LTDTKHCNQLDPKTLEALQILKDAYRKGIIDPDKELQKWASETWKPLVMQGPVVVDADSDEDSLDSSDEENND
jgi:hypothetical protein